MSSAHRIGESTQEGHAVIVLASRAGVEAAFAPGVGMVGCSLRHRGEELLGQGGGLDRYARTGSTMGIPLLHPWANRLEGFRYAVAAAEVELDQRRSPVHLDEHGLPIHGLAAASPRWEVATTGADDRAATVAARLDFGAHAELVAGFPFPHELLVTARLAETVLTIDTVLRPTGDAGVPVAFGYHPYLRLLGLARADWEVSLPVRRRMLLDDRGIPTGASEPVALPPGPLGARSFDDLFDELGDPPAFVLSGAGRRLEVCFERGYAFAQVYAPDHQEFICFEPMTAPTNALANGDPRLVIVEPPDEYAARFSVRIHAD